MKGKISLYYNQITIRLQSDYNRITIGLQTVASSPTHIVQAVPFKKKRKKQEKEAKDKGER